MTEPAAAREGSVPDDGLRAMVLGPRGFIGGHLVAGLVSQADFSRIVVAGSGAASRPGASIESVGGPVDAELFRRMPEPDVVFWAIGGASVGDSIRDPERDNARSIPPLHDLLARLSAEWPSARLVFISSAAVYGRAGSSRTSTHAPLLPMSPYGRHKVLSEEMIRRAMPEHGGRWSIVRPFSVFGPGLRRQLFWDALEKARRNELHFNGTGRELRDWLFVDDLVRLLIDIALFPGRFPPVLNAGTGNGIEVQVALQSLFSLLPGSPQPLFSGDSRAGDPDALVADAAQQQPLAGYFRTPFHEGLERYARWYRSAAG